MSFFPGLRVYFDLILPTQIVIRVIAQFFKWVKLGSPMIFFAIVFLNLFGGTETFAEGTQISRRFFGGGKRLSFVFSVFAEAQIVLMNTFVMTAGFIAGPAKLRVDNDIVNWQNQFVRFIS